MYYLLFWKGSIPVQVNELTKDYRQDFRSGELRYVIRVDDNSSFITFDQMNWEIINQVQLKKPLELAFERINKRFPNHKLLRKEAFQIEGMRNLYLFSSTNLGSQIAIFHDPEEDNVLIFQQTGYFDKISKELREYMFSLD